MRSMVEDLVSQLNRNGIIKPLIKNNSFIMSVGGDDQKIILKLTENYFSSIASEDDNPNVFLTGEIDSITKIFRGEILLRDAMNKGMVTIDAHLRKILFLESLFALNNIQTLKKKSS